MKKIALSFILLSLITLSLFAGRVISIDNPIYEYIDSLFLLEGKAMLSSSRPWSASVAQNELARIDKNRLSGLSLKLYSAIEEELDAFDASLDGFVSISPELYMHSNPSFDKPSLWDYSFEERKAFFSMGFSYLIDGFFLETGLSYRYGKATNKDSFKTVDTGIGALVPYGESISVLDSSYLYSKSVLFNLPEIDLLYLETPSRTNLGYDGKHVSLGYFRDYLSWGRSKIGNFIFDDHISSQDYLSFKLYDSNKAFDYVLLLPEVDFSQRWANIYSDKNRVMMAHMFSFSLLDSLSISISENVMYSYIEPELKYFNPLYVFHNLNNSDALNAIAHAELEFLPVNGLRLYSQVALDQAQAPTELEGQPAAYGVSLGAECILPFEDSFIRLSLEGALTTPFLYRRNLVDFIVFERYATNFPYQKYAFFTYLGFEYGGDAIALNANIEYFNLGGFSSKLAFLAVLHGGTNIYTSHSSSGNNINWPDIKLPILSDGGFNAFRISSDNRYSFKLLGKECECFLNAAFVFLKDDYDLQLAMGASIEL